MIRSMLSSASLGGDIVCLNVVLITPRQRMLVLQRSCHYPVVGVTTDQ